MYKELSLNIELQNNRKIYFLSDIHLGTPNEQQSLQREKIVVRFLTSIANDAQAIFFVGDIFDFWFEYKHAVPKYFIRFFAKIIELRENGIDIYFIKGNHDLWMSDYLEQLLDIKLVEDRILLKANKKTFFITHGDGKGPGDTKYKTLKKIFTNPICKYLFSWVHPDIGIKIAQTWSRHSFTDPSMEVFKGEDKEWLIQYCKKKLTEKHFDYFIMGHRHLLMQIQLNENSEYINLGDWIVNCNYAVFDGKEMNLVKYEE